MIQEQQGDRCTHQVIELDPGSGTDAQTQDGDQHVRRDDENHWGEQNPVAVQQRDRQVDDGADGAEHDDGHAVMPDEEGEQGVEGADAGWT